MRSGTILATVGFVLASAIGMKAAAERDEARRELEMERAKAKDLDFCVDMLRESIGLLIDEIPQENYNNIADELHKKIEFFKVARHAL